MALVGIRMLPRIGAAAAAIVLLALAAGSASAQTMQGKIRAGQPIIVATEDDYRPFEFMQDGKPAGLDNELFQLMKADAKFDLRQEILPWTGLLAGVSSGKFDAAVTGALINKERMKAFDFSMPIAANNHYYLKRANDNSIKSIKDLSGKTCGVQSGSVLFARLPELEAMLAKTGGKLGKVVQYASYPEAYQDLAAGRVDYVVNGEINLLGVMAERPGVFAMGQPVVDSPSYVGWPVKKGNKEMLDYLNGFLREVRANGKLQELQQKWLKVSFKDLPEHVEPNF
ncbi:MAG TPA: transporter substrate-binding domain-containing protein [Casimicrobiaceae bacterium]|nr:transporter substrate-binding domain-containing protein [Casimicrobiaceae bacterium]